MSKQYANRDICALDEAGNHYCRHVSAMTAEGLHSKSDIAAELGYRDYVIETLSAQRDELLAALEAAVDCGIVPTSSASEGGPMRKVRQVVVADQIRAAIAKAKGGAA
jgi:hypothetical protein